MTVFLIIDIYVKLLASVSRTLAFIFHTFAVMYLMVGSPPRDGSGVYVVAHRFGSSVFLYFQWTSIVLRPC